MAINPATFDMNLLRVLDALMRDGNVTVAADRLGLSQSAVSNALARLRRLTGDPLFIRTRTGMQATSYVAKLAHPLQDGLALIQRALSELATFDPKTSDRSFHLLLSDVGEVVVLPALVERLSHVAPAVRLCIRALEQDTYQDKLEAGGADLAIGLMTPRPNYRSRHLFSSSDGIAFRAGHPLLDPAQGGVLTLTNYLAASHVALERTGRSVAPVDRALAKSGLRRTIELSVPRFVGMPHILRRTDLVATAPQELIKAWDALDGIRIAALPFETTPTRIQLVWHARQDSDPGQRWLRELLADMFALRRPSESRQPRRR